MSNIKIDLLKLATEEIKDVCRNHKSHCLTCPLASKRMVEDEDRDHYWEVECPFENTKNPSEWKV